GEGGLAASGLAGESEDLPALELQVDVTDRVNRSFRLIHDVVIADAQKRVVGHTGTPPSVVVWSRCFRRFLSLRRVVVRSFGLTTSSIAKFTSESAPPSTAMRIPGGTNHHQVPRVSANPFCAWKSIVPQVKVP